VAAARACASAPGRAGRRRYLCSAHVTGTGSAPSLVQSCSAARRARAEELAAAAPAAPALAAAAVDVAATRAGDAGWAGWALPLAAGLLAAAVPTPAPHVWLRVPCLAPWRPPRVPPALFADEGAAALAGRPAGSGLLQAAGLCASCARSLARRTAAVGRAGGARAWLRARACNSAARGLCPRAGYRADRAPLARGRRGAVRCGACAQPARSRARRPRARHRCCPGYPGRRLAAPHPPPVARLRTSITSAQRACCAAGVCRGSTASCKLCTGGGKQAHMHVQCACISCLHGASAGRQQRAPGAPNLSWGVSLYLLHVADYARTNWVSPRAPMRPARPAQRARCRWTGGAGGGGGGAGGAGDRGLSARGAHLINRAVRQQLWSLLGSQSQLHRLHLRSSHDFGWVFGSNGCFGFGRPSRILCVGNPTEVGCSCSARTLAAFGMGLRRAPAR